MFNTDRNKYVPLIFSGADLLWERLAGTISNVMQYVVNCRHSLSGINEYIIFLYFVKQFFTSTNIQMKFVDANDMHVLQHTIFLAESNVL